MSWWAGANGRGEALRENLRKQFASNKCPIVEEEGVRQAAGLLIDQALAHVPEQPVKVEASGSMSTIDGKPVYSSFSIKVEPIVGFVE